MADLDFFFDPVCPFAWQTSRWIRRVIELDGIDVEWRFICLRIINADLDYAAEFPPNYEAGHSLGRSLLRVCASVRAAEGSGPIGSIYEAFGNELWNREPEGEGMNAVMGTLAKPFDVGDVLTRVGVDAAHAAAFDDSSWDVVLKEETDLAFSRTGPDVGTPIVWFDPPEGNSFFGPVISALPSDEEAVEIFRAIRTLTRFPTFSEIKRTNRPRLDLPLLRW